MQGMTFPGMPGLGLAAGTSTPRFSLREQDALRRDAWDREEAAYAKACPPAQAVKPATEKVTSPVRATAA